jgi:hypothetical protein
MGKEGRKSGQSSVQAQPCLEEGSQAGWEEAVSASSPEVSQSLSLLFPDSPPSAQAIPLRAPVVEHLLRPTTVAGTRLVHFRA